jgi:glucose/mannose-6-phosphate isomerase
MTVEPLGGEAIAAADPGGMLADVLAQPHQFGDALWRVESAGIKRGEYARGLVVCGMGGSAIGGDLAAAAIGLRARAPITTLRGYELPEWVRADTLVMCASYSGNTEETLRCFDQAGQIGAPRVAVTTGGELAAAAREAGVPVIGVPSGMQPRAAVVYMTVAALEVAELAGAAPSLRDEIEAAGALSGELAAEWGGDSADDAEPKRIARALAGRIPIVYGGRSTTAPARRWRSQLNENAKVPAFYGDLPEAPHNEVVGWHHTDAPLTAVILETPDEHERMEARFDITADVLDDVGLEVERVQARGDSPLERVMSLVLLGDLASVYLGVLLGKDPTPVAEIEALKARLSRR